MGATPVKLEEVRRQRREATRAEQVLWQEIRGSRLGVKFRNRHVVAGLIVDFYAPSIRVVIEVDGAAHDGREVEDAERTRALESLGIVVIRFTNDEVLFDSQRVIDSIRQTIDSRQPVTHSDDETHF